MELIKVPFIKDQNFLFTNRGSFAILNLQFNIQVIDFKSNDKKK